MFVTDVLRLLPGQELLIREVLQNYWDFQDRWAAIRPDYAHGMIQGGMWAEKDWTTVSCQFTLAPMVAWGVLRAYQANGDLTMVREALPRLRRYHDWYWRERDLHNNGLITVGNYLTLENICRHMPPEQRSLLRIVQQARNETNFDFEVCLDTLDVTPHPHDASRLGKAWYGTICTPGATSFLIHAEACLAKLAEVVGDTALARERRQRAAFGAEAMRQHMWDDEAGTFLAVRRDSLEKCPRSRKYWWEGPPSRALTFPATIGSWIPLLAGVPTPAQAARMADVLATPEWRSPAGPCTVGRSNPEFDPGLFWRGDAWTSTTYLIARGLADYGFSSLAADIADRAVANSMQHPGLSERYHADTGECLGLRDYAFACGLISLLADGITCTYRIELRRPPSR